LKNSISIPNCFSMGNTTPEFSVERSPPSKKHRYVQKFE
jgi:hypothetical protein